MDDVKDLVIIGSGIAGLTAAVYSARAGLKPIVLTGSDDGGQLLLTTAVENFPGFPDGIQGPQLIQRTKDQAKKFGAVFLGKNAIDFKVKDKLFEIKADEEKIISKTVIIATGASAKWLGVPSEQKYIGRGVSSCATCDAYFFKDKKTVVVGGGDSACEDALVLAKFATKVTIIHRRDALRASKIMQDRIFENKKINVIWDSVVEEILGNESKVTGIKIKNVKTNKILQLDCDGVFMAIGHTPNTEIFKGKINLNEEGFIVTDKRGRTNIPGAFAAGDVQDTIYMQAVTAAGSGCQAALEAERYLAGLPEKRR